MRDFTHGGRILPMPEKLNLIAEAGFDGVVIDLGCDVLYGNTEQKDTAPLVQERGLSCCVASIPLEFDHFKQYLEIAHRAGADSICCYPAIFSETVDGDEETIRKLLEIGNDPSLPVHFEMHRHTVTNDMLNTLQLLNRIPEMMLVCDLSHWMVVRELDLLPHTAGQHEKWIQRALDRCEHFQGRNSTPEIFQVPLDWQQYRDHYN